jgi:hypothetical protein
MFRTWCYAETRTAPGNMPRRRAILTILSASSITLRRSMTSLLQGCGYDRRHQLIRLIACLLNASLADVGRIAVLQVEMQMGAMDVVGFGAKHRGEYLAGALMHAPEELGLRK